MDIVNKEKNYNIKMAQLKNKEKENANKEKEIQKDIEDLINKQNELSQKEKNIKQKENDISKKEKEFKNKNNNIKKREEEIIKRENDFNKKMDFLEEKENYLDKKDNELENKKKNLQINLQNNLQNNLQFNPINNNINQNNPNNINQNQNIFNNNLNHINPFNLNQNMPNLNQNIQKPKHKRTSSAPTIPVKIEPLKSYIYQPQIGLNNIGSTCFKNSVLQCLSQTEDLTNYFLKETSINAIYNNNIAKKNKNALQLCPVYHELIKNLWDKNGRTSFSPDKFMRVIDDMSKNDVLAFKKGEAGDAKDFIIFILEQFHKELQKSVKKNNNQPTTPLNQYDKENCFNHFIEDFKENCSIISDIFFGFNETNTICLNCKKNYNSKGLNNPICYNYGIFNCLIFPLEEVKNMKMQSMQNNFIQMNINSVNLMECFFYNQKTDYFTGQNQNYCNLCKQLSDAIYVNKILSSPKYLILIIYRGKNNVFKIKLDFSEMLDLTQFVIQKDKPQIIYNLYGVITHIGESGPNAHFVAACRSPIDNKWYRYNDAIVTPINDYNKEVYNFGTPYILFYKKL